MEELEDPEMMIKEEKKVVTQQEYVSRLQELKTEIGRAWKADDRIKALKLSIKAGLISIFMQILLGMLINQLVELNLLIYI